MQVVVYSLLANLVPDDVSPVIFEKLIYHNNKDHEEQHEYLLKLSLHTDKKECQQYSISSIY